MISFGYTIIYVENVEKTLDFYHKSFGMDIRMITPEKDYGELHTGTTVLSFAERDLAQSHFKQKFVQNSIANNPPGFDIGLITDDVESYYNKALLHGAQILAEPTQKPWGQTVAYLRDINGIIVEIATPISA